MSKLKQCPFCGKEGIMVVYAKAKCYRMSCLNFCSVRLHKDPQSAANSWNTRSKKPEENNDDILDKPVETLELLSRTLNCLRAEKIYTIRDLTLKNKWDLLKVPNLGRKSLNEIKDALSLHGLSLKMNKVVSNE